ncbi:MAG: hypothetical protein V1797_04375 [Pseudomonadota bacterium]
MLLLFAMLWSGCSTVAMFSNIETYEGSYGYSYLGDGDRLAEAVVEAGAEQGYHLAGHAPGQVKLTAQIPMIGQILVGATSNTTMVCQVGEGRGFRISVVLIGNFGSAGKESSDNLAKQMIEALTRRGYMFVSTQSSPAETYAFLNAGVARHPDDAMACNNLAWCLATSSEAQYRDSSRAVELARKAVDLRRDSRTVDTLAAACAEAGNFAEAVRIQEEAIKLAGPDNKQIRGYHERLAAYRAGRPWRVTRNGGF